MELIPGFDLADGGIAPPPETARILIVDDEPRIRLAYRQLLAGAGREVEDCADGRSAQARLERRDIDVLILDPQLPDIDAGALLEWLVQSRIGCALIVFSASADIETAIAALRGGAVEFLRKSADPDLLIDAVHLALRRRRLEREHALSTARLEQSERLHRFLVEESPDIMYTLDRRGRFVFLNQRVETLLGYPRGELIGQHHSQIVAPEDRDKARYAFAERRIGERATSNHEIRLRCRGDGLRQFENRPIVAILSSQGVYRNESESSVQRFVGSAGVLRDITKRKAVEEALAFKAFHDPLTGLPNRRLFNDRLELALNQARRRRQRVGLMFIDLDRFKLVNDTYGHAGGDELLQTFARRIRACLRAGDTLSRLGGDEFTVLLPDIDRAETVATIARKVLAELATPFRIAGDDFLTTASIGIALFPDDGDNPDALLLHADQAMYRVKSEGRNGFRYGGEIAVGTRAAAVGLDRELREALAAGQFELHYQPQFSVGRRRVVGVEALLRWHHTERGLLAANSFIPFAVETASMLALGDWVLDRVAAQLAAWRSAGYADLVASINLSLPEFGRDDLVARILGPLAGHGLKPSDLSLDISEAMLVDDAESVISRVGELRAHGIGVSIDDFGTRYSSLNYLHRLAVSGLAIDRAFVQELAGGDDPAPVIDAILGIARGFGLRVLAKGVETQAQAERLQALGCDVMQGFRFSPPLPAADLGRLLAADALTPGRPFTDS